MYNMYVILQLQTEKIEPRAANCTSKTSPLATSKCLRMSIVYVSLALSLQANHGKRWQAKAGASKAVPFHKTIELQEAVIAALFSIVDANLFPFLQ